MRKKLAFITLALFVAVLLSGCVGSTNWPGLSAAEDVAYLANTTAVHAVNVKTGQEVWKFAVSGGFLNSNPSLFVATPVLTDGGLLIVPDSGNKHVIYALDPERITEKSPATVWSYDDADGHWIASPLVLESRIFAPNSDGNLYVLDLQDGGLIEKVFLSGKSDQTDRLWAKPVSDGTRIFITSLDHRIFAISLETYQVEWSQQLDAAIPGAPVIGADGMLYVGLLSKKLERFDPATGDHEAVLEQEIKDWVWGTPVVHENNLYFGDVAGNFYSFNTADQSISWELHLDGAITASPLLLGDQLLVATESGVIYSVSLDGAQEIWFQPEDVDAKAYSTPVLTGDYVLVAYIETDYYLVALDADGDTKWTFNGK